MVTGGNFVGCCGPDGTPRIDNEIEILCDVGADGTVTPFLRRYSVEGDVVTATDWELDGTTPYIAAGEVTVCGDLTPDESPGEPCDETTPVTVAGVCLADGTPLAITIVRDCAGTILQTGWINLTTGAFSAGAPPVGTIACGETRSIQVSGVFCDLDPATGDVLGLVLIEYQYNPDGSIASVTLLDATTGLPYTVQGELSVCPAGVEQPDSDLITLCDADGVQFVRDYRRDENGQIVGFTDYDLEGNAYAPVEPVGLCDESPAEPCTTCESHVLCDTPQPEFVPPSPAQGTLPNGVTYDTVQLGGVQIVFEPLQGRSVVGTVGNPSGVLEYAFDQPVDATWYAGHTNAQAAADKCIVMPEGAKLVELHPEHTYDPATRRLCWNGPAVDSPAYSRFSSAAVAGLLFTPDPAQTAPPSPGQSARVVGLEVVPAGSPSTPFLRTICRDCDGEFLSSTDTMLDGTTEYVPSGVVGVCGPTSGEPEECRNTSTLLVCDLPTDGEPDPTVTDTDPTVFFGGPSQVPHPGGGQVLWDGGTLTIPGDNAGSGGTVITQRSLAAIIQAGQPACDTGTATLTVSLDLEQIGPDVSCGGVGALRLFNNGVFLVQDAPPSGPPVGWTGTLTVSASVPSADVAAGNIAVGFVIDTYQENSGCNGGVPVSTGWELDNFVAGVEFDVSGDCTNQILANVVTDCDGNVVSVTYTTLDGTPYTPTGEVGQCQAAGGGCCPPEPCRNTSTLLVCDLPTDGDPDPAVADTDPTPLLDAQTSPGANPVAGGAAALWSGGTLTIPPDTGPAPDGFAQHTRTFAATVQAQRPACDTGMATVTATMRVERNGPDPGCQGTGSFHLIVGATSVAVVGVPPQNIPVGTVNLLTVTAQVPAADLAAGDVALLGRLETYHLSSPNCVDGSGPGGARIGGWTVDQFELTAVYDQTGCAAQVFANVVTDCETGQVISVEYTTPDGQPYTPIGEIGDCTPAGPATQPCNDCETITLCDSGDQTDTIPGDGTTAGTLANGVGWSTDASTSAIGTPAEGWFLLQGFPPNPQMFSFDTPVTVEFQLTTDGPFIEVSPGAEPVELHPNHTWDPATRQLNSTSGDLADRSVFATTAPSTGVGLLAPATGDAAGFAGAFAVTLQGEGATFLRRLCYGCGGELLSVTDTELDGVTDYTPVGDVGVCGPSGGEPEECRDAATVLLCDLDTTGAEPEPVVTNTDPTPYFRFPNLNEVVEPPAEAANFWAGNPETVGPDPASPAATHRYLAATVQAARPACDDGTATVTASFDWVFNGPNPGFGGTGQVWLKHVSTVPFDDVAGATFPSFTAVGASGTITISATVDAAELAAGNYVLVTNPETNHQGEKSWTFSNFAATAAFNQADCAEQFLRKIVTDCDGNTVSVTDQTLDGDPYTVTGDVGDCQPIAPDPCQVASTFEKCRCDDLSDESPGEVVCYTEIWSISCEGGAPTLIHTYQDDPATEYVPTNPVDCADVATESAQVVGVKTQRLELAPGDTWDAAGFPLLQSVTAVGAAGEGQITTDAGASTLYQGEHATWSVVHEFDLTLQGPLNIEATTGAVTVTWTEAITS